MLNSIKTEIKKTVVGKTHAIESIMIALLSEGHVLIEDLPGLGKTTLAKSFAKALNCTFTRIQFTPDLMPSDLIGVSIYDKNAQKFVFQKGPLFTNILLADEINRTSPKTQSSLLEAMEELQVTIDGTTYGLTPPFLVIATENPIELQGTFPLPEAQLDRFMMRVNLGYPTESEELEILSQKDKPMEISPVVTLADFLELKSKMNDVFVDPALKAYIVSLMKATREHVDIRLGGSPRASVHLYKGAKAKALLNQRAYVIPSDISTLFETVVGHRIILKGEAQYRGTYVREILESILNSVEVPKVTR
ncbi:AAA family ATPase [Fusibacter tunisiensis]|uniref:MoxR-like ATPase n=1 Tax=Fusibacter tunisiensis TaxID=1008308 RepID=A0ABS2MNI7_9FIRM|nr:MoxR family ATPase [Fusibacter tunisiensis]MBM7560961.1 MoxR-like ATPase [Fusibacter tunisiensis]